jgi:isocitrate dehydrogenase
VISLSTLEDNNSPIKLSCDLITVANILLLSLNIFHAIVHPEKVNMTIFRENTEDIYAGIEYLHGTPELEKLKKFLK